MKKFLYTLSFLVLTTSTSFAQDFHFSQFYLSPLTQNPGNTGVFNGDIRAYTVYRMQWFTVATPYKTFTVGIDGAIFRNKMRRDDFFALGFNFSNDNGGNVRLKQNSFNLLASFTKFIGGRQKHQITLGYEIGYNIKSATYGGLKWNSQWDGTNYNPGMGTGEPGGGAIGYIDMSTGLVWNFTTTHLFRSALGFSFHHFTAPNTTIRGGYDKIWPKLGVQWNIGYKLSETSNTTLMPSLMAYQQGSSLLINGGLNIKYVLEERSRYTTHQTDKAFYIGAFYRFRDAAYVTLRYDYMDFSGGVAYDINISQLTPASKSVGGFELFLQYRGILGKNQNAKRSSVRFM